MKVIIAGFIKAVLNHHWAIRITRYFQRAVLLMHKWIDGTVVACEAFH
jgi:hypothetical protein